MSSFRFIGMPRAGEAQHSIISSCVIRQPQPSLSILAHNSSHCQHHRDCCINRVVAAVAKEAANHHHQQQQHRSSNLVALEYADLNLQMPEELGSARIRQHVNPFKASLSFPVQVPEWNQIFKDSTLPLMVDIGSGSGRFLMWLAKRNVDSRNYLGLEIRQKLVKRAEFWVKGLALHNIHFMFTNATVSFQQLVSTYPGPLTLVSILCPDPHFKKRHHKRRVVQKPLVNSIVNNLVPGGQEYVGDSSHGFGMRATNPQYILDPNDGMAMSQQYNLPHHTFSPRFSPMRPMVYNASSSNGGGSMSYTSEPHQRLHPTYSPRFSPLRPVESITPSSSGGRSMSYTSDAFQQNLFPTQGTQDSVNKQDAGSSGDGGWGSETFAFGLQLGPYHPQ